MRKTGEFILIVILCVVFGSILSAIFTGGDGLLGSVGDVMGGDSGSSGGSGSTCYHVGNTNDLYLPFVQTDGRYPTSHTYSSVCLDCGKQLVEPTVTNHAYIDGVCKCGYVCDHPKSDDAGNCTQCKASVDISFTVEGTLITIGKNATWADVVTKYNVFVLDAKNRVTFNGYVVTDGAGYAVYDTYRVVAGEAYVFCPHNTLKNAVFTVYAYSNNEHSCSYTCGVCDKSVVKKMYCSFNNGICELCGRICSHSWNDTLCTICGTTHTHNNVDGVCTVCGEGCAHAWSEGTCTACGAVCKHPGEYPNGVCEVCGVAQLGFEIDGDYWVAPEGATWVDMLKYTQAFELDEKDRMIYKGGVLLGQNGQPVEKNAAIVIGAQYITCTHEASSVTYTEILEDNSAHNATYLCSVCGHSEIELQSHRYDLNLCVECDHLCSHVAVGNDCQWCEMSIDTFYVNDSYVYFPPRNHNWPVAEDFEDFEIIEGVVYWRGYVLTDADGYRITEDMAIIDQGYYYTCQHKHLIEDEAHTYFNPTYHVTKQYCSQCSVLVNEKVNVHSWSDGQCVYCEYECQHPLGEGLLDHCEQCGVLWSYFTVDGYLQFYAPGMTYGDLERWGTSFDCDYKAEADNTVTKHSKPMKYADGTNVLATDVIGPGDVLFAAHSYDEDGICTDCGAACPHGLHDQDGNCTTCGVLTGHGTDNFDENNVCKVCGYTCPHDSFIDGECEYCGRGPTKYEISGIWYVPSLDSFKMPGVTLFEDVTYSMSFVGTTLEPAVFHGTQIEFCENDYNLHYDYVESMYSYPSPGYIDLGNYSEFGYVIDFGTAPQEVSQYFYLAFTDIAWQDDYDVISAGVYRVNDMITDFPFEGAWLCPIQYTCYGYSTGNDNLYKAYASGYLIDNTGKFNSPYFRSETGTSLAVIEYMCEPEYPEKTPLFVFTHSENKLWEGWVYGDPSTITIAEDANVTSSFKVWFLANFVRIS